MSKKPSVQQLVLDAAGADDLTLDGAMLAGFRLVLYRAAKGELPLSGTALANLISAASQLKAAGGGSDPLAEMTEWLGSVPDELSGGLPGSLDDNLEP